MIKSGGVPSPLGSDVEAGAGTAVASGSDGPDDLADHYRAWLAAIVEHSDDAIISKDLDGIITSWNAGASRLFGYEAPEVIGKPITILIPEGRQEEEPQILARIRQGERIDHFDTVRRHKDGSLIEVSLTVSPVKDAAGRIVGASKIARDITERRQLERRQSLILGEMNHRIRNTLATVQALAAQTMRSGRPEERAAFSSRLQSLARAHDLLTLERWNQTSVAEVIDRALEVFDEEHGRRFSISGAGEPRLEPGRAMMLAMALHELATNAIKYGALSVPGGRVRISWDLAAGERRRHLALVWSEEFGPPVAQPERHGFGTRLIELSGGRVDYREAGVVCTVSIPLEPSRNHD
jgi:PAS domain S-box-containing protein